MTLARIALLVLLPSLALGMSSCGKSDESKDAKKQEAPPAASSPAESTPAPVAAPQSADGITARAKLDQVVAEAGKWQADAQLFGVFTSFTSGPSAVFWLYDFQSPASKTCTRLRAFANGKLDTAEASHECRIRKPVARDFVDSPAAMASAVAAGMKTGGSVEFSLRFLKDTALTAPRACWVISSDFDADGGVTRAWCVDPASGTFVVRLSGYGGPVFE